MIWSAIPKRTAARSGVLDFIPNSQLQRPTQSLQVATYNIHGTKGMDGVRDLNRTAQAIKGADIVALQEVHTCWKSNQAERLATTIGLGYLFIPTLRRWFRDYRGNGLLTRFPVKHWQTHLLPNVAGHRYRVYSIAEVVLDNKILSILFTHLHTRKGREQQLKIVLDHFGSLPLPAILLGDLNTTGEDPTFKENLPADAIDAVGNALGSQDSAERIDWILVRGLDINSGGYLGKGVSDHPYYWVEVLLGAVPSPR
ncbi:MAG: endonuclease/exonuclease/phosphatase family protein [Arenicellales bacterium]|nr:endonuclease/exonuclease/phosphatase family protein [Arenicellales bacterium]